MFDFCSIWVVENKSQEKKKGKSVLSKVREELGTVKINMDDTSIPGAQNPSRSPIRSPTCTRFETPDPPESRSVSSPCGPAPCWRPDSRSTRRPATRTRSRRCTWTPGHWKNWAVGDQLKECQRKLNYFRFVDPSQKILKLYFMKQNRVFDGCNICTPDKHFIAYIY